MPEDLSQRDREVLLAFAECDMRVLRTAKKLYMSQYSIPYHLKRIEEKTGLNPYKFYDLVKLLGFNTNNKELLTELKQAKRLISGLCAKCGENVHKEGVIPNDR